MEIKDLEKKRAVKAYEYASNGKDILSLFKIGDEFYQDNKYKSYVKKMPMMILNNGLGATFAFIYSKRTKTKKEKRKGREKEQIIKAGEEKNPKNAYDLIYKQVDEWLQKSYIQKPQGDLMEWIISQNSQEYRATTNEVLALFDWLRRFAEGMIEDKEDGI